jgi:VWFA-related protein
LFVLLTLTFFVQVNDTLRFDPLPPSLLFPGELSLSLSSTVAEDDLIGLEIFINGESVHYFDARPFATEIDLSLFEEGDILIEARLERFDGTIDRAQLRGKNKIPDHSEDVTMVRIPVLALSETQIPSAIRGDFRIYENGDEKPVAMLFGEEKPLDLLVLLDMSGSMHRRTHEIMDGLDALMDLLRPRDRLHVIGFNNLVFEISPPESDMDLVRRRLRSVVATGPTNLYGAIWSGLKTISHSRQRRAIVVFTDGDHDLDEARDPYEKTLEECIGLARGQGIPIYAVGLGVSLEVEVLSHLTEQTGGKAFIERSADTLRRAFAAIGEQLRHQYLVCYYTKATRSGWYEIRVTSRSSGPVLRYPNRVYLRF